jgi:hypothetical protein
MAFHGTVYCLGCEGVCAVTGKAYANRKLKKDRPKGDFYGTPISLLRELLETELLIDSRDILEPFCGKGNLSNELIKIGFKTTAFDLYYGKKRQDFLKYNNQHNCIISNPPFSEFDKMVMHCKKIAKHVYLIGKTNFYGAYKRNQNGIWKNLKKIYVFDRQVDYRTPYRKDGHFHVGNLVTGWHIWERGYNGPVTWEIMPVNKYATLGAYKGK